MQEEGEKLMTKSCIFNLNKTCESCGTCDVCDLDSNKICNNCGKCLETEVNDFKQIVIDEVDDINDETESDNFPETEIKLDYSTKTNFEDDDLTFEEEEDSNLEFIDDVEGLSELLEDPDNKTLIEVAPGLFILNSNKKELH